MIAALDEVHEADEGFESDGSASEHQDGSTDDDDVRFPADGSESMPQAEDHQLLEAAGRIDAAILQRQRQAADGMLSEAQTEHKGPNPEERSPSVHSRIEDDFMAMTEGGIQSHPLSHTGEGELLEYPPQDTEPAEHQEAEWLADCATGAQPQAGGGLDEPGTETVAEPGHLECLETLPSALLADLPPETVTAPPATRGDRSHGKMLSRFAYEAGAPQQRSTPIRSMNPFSGPAGLSQGDSQVGVQAADLEAQQGSASSTEAHSDESEIVTSGKTDVGHSTATLPLSASLIVHDGASTEPSEHAEDDSDTHHSSAEGSLLVTVPARYTDNKDFMSKGETLAVEPSTLHSELDEAHPQGEDVSAELARCNLDDISADLAASQADAAGSFLGDMLSEDRHPWGGLQAERLRVSQIMSRPSAEGADGDASMPESAILGPPAEQPRADMPVPQANQK